MKNSFTIIALVVTNFTFAQLCNTSTNMGTITPTTTPQSSASFTGRSYFAFVAQSGCEYTFSTCGLTSENTILRLYDAAFNELLIVNNNVCGSGDQMTVLINQSGTYYVHIGRSSLFNSCNTLATSNQISYFKNCTFDDHECYGATQICNDAPFSGNSANGGNYQELGASNQGCLSGGEHQSYWYYFQPVMNGTISFTLNTCGTCDYDFAVWATGNCGNLGTPVRCSFAAPSGDTGLGNGAVDLTEGTGGDKYVAPLNVVAGQTYILLIDNYTANSEPFAIDFTFSVPGLLNCTPVVLPVELSKFSGSTIGETNVLAWETEHEVNVDHFILEWSDNPVDNNWKQIAVVDAKGGLNPESYRFAHQDPTLDKINYYRLSEIDFNGGMKTMDQYVVLDNTVSKSKVIRLYNPLGQEVDSNYKGVVILLFEDGSTQRKLNN